MMQSRVQSWKNGRRGEDKFRLKLGRLQGNSNVIKCRCDLVRQSHVESIHTQATDHCKEQR